MYERKMIPPQLHSNLYPKRLYFIHHLEETTSNHSIPDIPYIHHKFEFSRTDLTKNNYALLKQYVKNGVTPSELLNAIRDDDVVERLVKNLKDYNPLSKIDQSLYE